MSTPEEKRRAVLEATLRVLAREGPRGVTHRAVSKEAGLGLRAATYYFDSREHLLTEALRHYADTAIARFDGLALTLPQDPEQALQLASMLLAHTVISDLVDDRPGLVAEYELVLEVERNPTLEPTYQRWQERLEEILGDYARQLGAKDPTGDARLVLATLRGLELEALARPSHPAAVDDLQAVFHRLLSALYATNA